MVRGDYWWITGCLPTVTTRGGYLQRGHTSTQVTTGWTAVEEVIHVESKWSAICTAAEGKDLGFQQRHLTPEGYVPLGMPEKEEKDWSERSRKPEVDWLLSPKQNGHRRNLDQEVLQMS